MRALSAVALFVLAAFAAGMALRESTVSQRLTIAAGPDEGEAYALANAIGEVAERHYPRLARGGGRDLGRGREHAAAGGGAG